MQQNDLSGPLDSLRSIDFNTINEVPVFQLPIEIEFYKNGKKSIKKIEVKYISEVFRFPMDSEPDLVIPDPDWSVPGTRKIENNPEQWVNQFLLSNSFFARLEALKVIEEFPEDELPEKQIQCYLSALFDSTSTIACSAIAKFNTQKPRNERISETIIRLAQTSPDKSIRSAAITAISSWEIPNITKLTIAEEGLKDSSYQVMTKSLELLYKIDSVRALALCKDLMHEKNTELLSQVAAILGSMGSKKDALFFEKKFDPEFSAADFQIIRYYSVFLKRQSGETLNNGIRNIANVAQNHKVWFVRAISMEELKSLQSHMAETLIGYGKSTTSEMNGEEKITQQQLDEIGKVIQTTIQSEKDERLKAYYMR